MSNLSSSSEIENSAIKSFDPSFNYQDLNETPMDSL